MNKDQNYEKIDDAFSDNASEWRHLPIVSLSSTAPEFTYAD